MLNITQNSIFQMSKMLIIITFSSVSEFYLGDLNLKEIWA